MDFITGDTFLTSIFVNLLRAFAESTEISFCLWAPSKNASFPSSLLCFTGDNLSQGKAEFHTMENVLFTIQSNLKARKKSASV